MRTEAEIYIDNEGNWYSNIVRIHFAQKTIDIETTVPANVKYFQAVKFVDQFNGWALASDYFDNFSPTFLFGTKDGGNNWKIVNIINSIPTLDIKPINKDTLWIGGGSNAKFVKTFDGGITLNYSFLDTVFAREIAPQSGLQGWICHRKPYNFSNYNQIMFTSNGGITWKEEYRIKKTVLGMCTLNNYLWIVGVDGLILKKTPLKTSVKETQEISVEPKILLQNYPNPFNSQTIISYKLPKYERVTIMVYDLLGKEIAKLIDKEINAGMHTIIFNPQQYNLASGVYLYSLKTSTQQISKQMVYLK
jgi:hypothetical protein